MFHAAGATSASKPRRATRDGPPGLHPDTGSASGPLTWQQGSGNITLMSAENVIDNDDAYSDGVSALV